MPCAVFRDQHSAPDHHQPSLNFRTHSDRRRSCNRAHGSILAASRISSGPVFPCVFGVHRLLLHPLRRAALIVAVIASLPSWPSARSALPCYFGHPDRSRQSADRPAVPFVQALMGGERHDFRPRQRLVIHPPDTQPIPSFAIMASSRSRRAVDTAVLTADTFATGPARRLGNCRSLLHS